jgi:hypothetical protein
MTYKENNVWSAGDMMEGYRVRSFAIARMKEQNQSHCKS